LSLDQIGVELTIEFDEDFGKEVFNGKSSLAGIFGLFVPSTFIYRTQLH